MDLNDRSCQSNIIEIDDLVTQIGGKTIHDHLSTKIPCNEIFGVLGGSGSGKTVLLNTLLGLFPKTSGRMKIFGLDSENVHHSFAHKKRMGILFQRGALFSSLSVIRNIMVPMIEQGGITPACAMEIAYFKLKTVGLSADTASKLPEELSGGMVKRVALARALALDADLVFLDEPTSGLDPISAEAFDELILNLKESLGLSVVMITHDLGSLSICDRLGVILDSKMLTGTLAEIQENPHPWIHEYFSGKRSRVMGGDKR